jgi:hypothetical protein
MGNKKGDVDVDTLVYWVVGALIVIGIILLYLQLTGRLDNIAKAIKLFLRFGR